MAKLPLSARIMRLIPKIGPEAFHRATSFDEVSNLLELDEEDCQAILDAYGGYGNDLDIVAEATKHPSNTKKAKEVSKDVCARVWAHIAPEVSGFGFLRLHASLLVGGHPERFARCTRQAAIKAEDVVTPQAVAAARAAKSARGGR